jgi:tetratricopeptide (TPR) repeat protein
MKTRFFLVSLSLLVFTSTWTPAQTMPAPPVTPTTDPAKIASFEKRFAQGMELKQEGKLADARAIFESILAEAPDAKGSLLQAGLTSLLLNELPKADDYLERYHNAVPYDPGAIEALIQINQTLKRDVKVIRLIQELHQLHASGQIPEFSKSLQFRREILHLDDGMKIAFDEFFNYHDEPYIVWMAKAADATGHHQRQILLAYDPEATKEIRAKDPKFAASEEFLLVEDIVEDGHLQRIDVYKQLFALPEYEKTRNTILAVFANALKPISSQDVSGAPAK